MTDEERLVGDPHLRSIGIVGVNVRGEDVHLECRTEDQRGLTVRFLRARDVPGRVCSTCKVLMEELPDGA